MQTVEETIEVLFLFTGFTSSGRSLKTFLAEKTGAALGFDNMQVRADLLRFKEFIETQGSGTDAYDCSPVSAGDSADEHKPKNCLSGSTSLDLLGLAPSEKRQPAS